MDNANIERMAHELAFGKFLNCLITDYKDVKLSSGQIYTLYQKCCDVEEFVEIINTGASEELP